MHAAITASLHDVEATVMHLTGAVNAGATNQEILETALMNMFCFSFQKSARKS